MDLCTLELQGNGRSRLLPTGKAPQYQLYRPELYMSSRIFDDNNHEVLVTEGTARFDSSKGPKSSRYGVSAPRPITRKQPLHGLERAEIPPLLITAYGFEPLSHPEDVSNFLNHQHEANMFEIRTWMDATLLDLQLMLQRVWSSIDSSYTITFYRCRSHDLSSGSVTRLGLVPAAASFESYQPLRLSSTSFAAGDELFITLH